MRRSIVALTLAAGFIFSFSGANAQNKKQPPTKLPPKKSSVKQPKASRTPIDPNRTIRIQYANISWNKDSTKIDTASVVLRDKNTGKTVQFRVYETAPDSSIFSGVYNVTWANISAIAPEVLVPSEQLGDEAPEEIQKKKSLSTQFKKLPFIFRKGLKGEQLVEVFNNRQDALNALEAYKKAAEAKETPKDTVASKTLLEGAELAKLEAEKRKQETETLARENERRRLEEVERQKQDELRRKQEALSAAEKGRRKKMAEEFGKKAMEQFQASQFVEAEENFRKSYEYDPENPTYYYAYGVTLFRNNKFNESLVTLRNAKEGSYVPAERSFFMGLNYMKLNEDENALKAFSDVKATKDETLAPSAAFYEGTILFKQTKYEPAKASFQEVLDTSKDPKLDESAEAYIERIEATLYYLRNRAKKIFVTYNVGYQYDSNVLLISSSDLSTGTASSSADNRTVSGLGLEYRPLYTNAHELSVKAKTDYIFSSKSTNVVADPFLYSIKTPYKYKGTVWGKGLVAEVTAGYEVLQLDTNSSGANKSFIEAIPEKEPYLNSILLDSVNTFVMNENWFTGASLKLRSDKAYSPPSTADSDPSAFKITLGWNNMFFRNKKKSQAILTDLGITQNSAIGKDLTYSRADLSGTYAFPLPYEFQGAGTLAFYYASYTQRTDGRKDTNITGSINLIRGIWENYLKGMLGVSYSTNQSNVTANTYDKYLITAMIMGEWSY